MDKSRKASQNSVRRSKSAGPENKRVSTASIISQSPSVRLPRKSRKTKKAGKAHKDGDHHTRGGNRTRVTKKTRPGARRSDTSTTGTFAPNSVLRIPRKVRVKIWKFLGFADILHLRLTCKSIKKDIDNFVGVKVELDDIDESFPYLVKLGIQCIIILDILTVRGQFLQRPELLTDLQILGGVQPLTFTQLLLDCQNLSHLTIQFNKDLCAAKPKLFPVDLPRNSQRKILQRLKFLRMEASIKTDQDLRYVRNNFVGLVQKHLLDQVHLYSIHVVITHKSLPDVISECSHVMATFVCNNCSCLRELHSEIRLVLVVNLVDEFLKSKDLGGGVEFTDLIQAELCPEPKNPPWTNFQKLEVLHFSSSPRDFFCFWEKMAQKLIKLETISLEIQSPVSWHYYKKFVEPCPATLKAVRFLECDNFGPVCQPLPIDLRLFRKCKKLEALVVVQSKSSGVGSKLTHLSSLPSGLKEVDFNWLIMDWNQAIKLARFPHMQILKIAYFSPSNASFGRFLCFLRWLYSCGCSRLKEFIIVDHKIRYQQNKKLLNNLLKHKSVHAEYGDYDETWLELRQGTDE